MRERELISINEREKERDVRTPWLEMSKFERERETEEIRESQRVRDKDMRDRKKMRERKRKNES